MKKTIAVKFPCTQEQKTKLMKAAAVYANVIFLDELPAEQQEPLLTSANIIIGEPDMVQIMNNPNLEWD